MRSWPEQGAERFSHFASPTEKLRHDWRGTLASPRRRVLVYLQAAHAATAGDVGRHALPVAGNI